jgi:hypothetical protein
MPESRSLWRRWRPSVRTYDRQLGHLERELRALRISRAIALARRAPREDFAEVLAAHMPPLSPLAMREALAPLSDDELAELWRLSPQWVDMTTLTLEELHQLRQEL